MTVNSNCFRFTIHIFSKSRQKQNNYGIMKNVEEISTIVIVCVLIANSIA